MTAPLRFALVEISDIDEKEGSIGDDLYRENWKEGWNDCRETMLAASPGNDLLERIVGARDRLGLVRSGRDYGAFDTVEAVDKLLAVLDELGGGHG